MNRHIILAAALLAGATSSMAQTLAPAQAPAASSSASSASDLVEGEVRKVDKSAGKITLRHGEIRNLDMPAMTMVFVAAKPEMLDQVKAGDKVRFRAANNGGAFTVTEIQPAR